MKTETCCRNDLFWEKTTKYQPGNGPIWQTWGSKKMRWAIEQIACFSSCRNMGQLMQLLGRVTITKALAWQNSFWMLSSSVTLTLCSKKDYTTKPQLQYKHAKAKEEWCYWCCQVERWSQSRVTYWSHAEYSQVMKNSKLWLFEVQHVVSLLARLQQDFMTLIWQNDSLKRQNHHVVWSRKKQQLLRE